jgi:hypothetical protein
MNLAVPLEKRLNPMRFSSADPILLALRQHRAEGAGDTDRLVQFLDGPFDVVVGFEDRVGVEDEFDVGVQLAGLPFDRRRLADRLAPLNRAKLHALLGAERSGPFDGAITAAIVDQDDLSRSHRLPQHRRQAEDDVVGLIQCRNDDIDFSLTPVFRRRRPRRIGAAQNATQTEKRARTKNEIRYCCQVF